MDEKYLKDKKGNLITIFGRPVVISDDLPELKAKDIIFGEFKDVNIFFKNQPIRQRSSDR